MGIVRVDLKAAFDSVTEVSSDDSALFNGLQSTVRLRFVVISDQIYPAYHDFVINANGVNEAGEEIKIMPTGSRALEPNVPVGDSLDYPRWILTNKEITKLGNLYYQVDCTWSYIPDLRTTATYQINGIRV